MSRLPRIYPVGIAQHIIQRRNNRQICFGREQDFFAYVGWLKVNYRGQNKVKSIKLSGSEQG